LINVFLETFRSYGCGSPLAPFLKGCTVVDLGSGVGKDCYTAAYLVGGEGRVVGIDMTDTALELSRSYIEYHQKAFGYEKPNVEFHKATIEKTGLPDGIADVVMSNCVINLTPDKRVVYNEVFRVLKEGGEMFFSDVYSNVPVPESLRTDPTLWGECISGALPFDAFLSMVQEVGFGPAYEVGGYEIVIQNEAIAALIKERAPDLKFFSKTMRLIKLPKNAKKEEKVDQKVVLKDGEEFLLSKDIIFDAMLPKWIEDPLVLAALKETRYREHFDFL
jgi:arsenite methyltransferase